MSNFGCVVLGSPVPVTFGSEPSTILDLFDSARTDLASRLVIVTSARSAEVVRRALKMEVHAIFLAPCDAPELRKVVHICLRGVEPPRRLYGTATEIEQLVTQDVEGP